MFHLQLRQFPHNHCRFNLTERELRSITEPWVRGQWLTIGERKWNAHQAKLTVIEAPRIAMQQLSMGRGWRHVQREGHDVTERMLAGARDWAAGPAAGPTAQPAPAVPVAQTSVRHAACDLPADAIAHPSPAGAIRTLLGDGRRAEELLVAWQQTAERYPNRSPSECLALAEEELKSRSGGADQ